MKENRASGLLSVREGLPRGFKLQDFDIFLVIKTLSLAIKPPLIL